MALHALYEVVNCSIGRCICANADEEHHHHHHGSSSSQEPNVVASGRNGG